MKDLSERDLQNNIPLATKQRQNHKTVVRVGSCEIGGEQLVVMAGPCTIENFDQVMQTAKRVKAAGGRILRGGAYKPMTFPYRTESAFELGEEGLKILREVRKTLDIPIVTEVVDVRLVGQVADYADMIQIGARNMQNFPLLEEVARVKKPVLLKRHFGASLRDWLGSAEYFLYNGCPDVVLCERGISAPHTHLPTSRFIVDLQVVPAAQEVTHLPIVVDPSHATFRRDFVPAVSRAAVAIGADGLLIEVHPKPEKAAVDPLNAISFDTFDTLMKDLAHIAPVVGKRIATRD